MSDSAEKLDLPLRWKTPDRWATGVLEDSLALLNDHVHLEKKAARNALELLDRWPDPTPPDHWVQTMIAVARDEVDHLSTVSRLLTRRGGHITKHHRNAYAGELRMLVRMGQGLFDLMDRLMVSALIEARSCERFEILSRCCTDSELTELYRQLWKSEKGHYLVFHELAALLLPEQVIQKRWHEMLEAEAQIIAQQAPGPGMHSGLTRSS